MKLTPRRRPEGDQPPSRGPIAAYAGILDGRHLWLTLEHDEPVALRDPGSGTAYPLESVTDLLALLPADEATYDVVVGEGRRAQSVWTPPLDSPDPIRIPVSPDGLTRFSLLRSEQGSLRVHRAPAPPTALLEAIELRGPDVHLTLRPPGGVRQGDHLLLLDTDDQVLDVLPVTAHSGHVEALIGAGDLPAGYFGIVRFALGTEAEWVKIRRGRSDLADPHRAVLLPELHDQDGDEDRPRARFRWNPDSLLVVRVLDPDELDHPPATVTPLAGGRP